MKTARSSLLRSAACALFVGGALASPEAGAQPAPAGSTAVAEGLFQQARDLFKQERYVEACPKFAESQRLEPKLGTLLNLAVCHEKLGKIATAWAEYTSAAAIARREGSREREDFAREKVADLEKKLPRLILQVGVLDARPAITLDEQPLDAAGLNMPLPIDPGKHRIDATAPGKIAWSTVIDAPAERTELRVKIPELAPLAEPKALDPIAPPPAGSAPVVASAAPIAPPASPVVPPEPAPKNRTLAYAGFGVGVAGVLVGAITGTLTLARASEIRGQCADGHCPVAQQDALDSAGALANVSNVAFALGAVGAGVGVAALLWSKPSEPAAKTGVAITPILGPGVVGARGTF